jgi:small subunit ribosomal protein S1
MTDDSTDISTTTTETPAVETPAAATPTGETTTVEAPAAGAPATESAPDAGPKIVEGSEGYLIEVDGEIVPNYDITINVFTEGDIVTGKVVRVDKDEVLVDIGYKSEGVIPVNELSIRKNVNTSDEVALGEEIDALVMQKEDADGRLILSKKRARFEKAWKRIEAAHESGTPVQGTVIEVVKGGLILDLGVRGFLPASLVDIRRVQDLSEYVGQQLNCRVIEMNRNRNNVVLSRRAVLEEERKEVRQQIIDELNVGDVVEGTISNIVDFGAFVDLDGIDGLIHISELSWTHINHPSEVLQVNQKVKVKVLDIDRDRQRISLGLKQTQEDPWQKIVAQHKVGDIVDGRVTKIVAFGAFVEIYAGIEGLVHISELANRHVERPDEIVAVNQQVSVKIIEVDSERRRLSLSIKRVDGENVRPMRPAEPADEADADAAAVAEETFAEAAEEPVAEETAASAAEEPLAEAEAETAAEPESKPEAVAEEAEAEPEPPAPAVPEHEPTLGLSDEVFPQGAASVDETVADDAAETAAAEEGDAATAAAEAGDADKATEA